MPRGPRVRCTSVRLCRRPVRGRRIHRILAHLGLSVSKLLEVCERLQRRSVNVRSGFESKSGGSPKASPDMGQFCPYSSLSAQSTDVRFSPK
jgi:hypothetical protein